MITIPDESPVPSTLLPPCAFAVLPRTQRPEVFRRLGHDVGKKLEDDLACDHQELPRGVLPRWPPPYLLHEMLPEYLQGVIVSCWKCILLSKKKLILG